MNKTLILLRLFMLDLWGFNRLRHSEDRRGKRRFIGVVLLAVILTPILILYIVGFSISFAYMGLLEYILPFIAFISCLLVVFSSFTKAATLLFGGNDHDLLTSLPVRPGELLAGRLFTLYIHQLPFTLLSMIPAMTVYALHARPGFVFYILALPLLLLLPLVPLIISSALGAAVTWFGARFRYKNLVTAVLAVAFITILFIGPMLLSYNLTGAAVDGGIATLAGMVGGMLDGIIRVYPPVLWMSGALGGKVSDLLVFLVLNAAVFIVFILFLSKKSESVRAALLSRRAAPRAVRQRDFRSASAFSSLYRKEIRRLFASVIYLLNTATGGVMAVLLAVMTFFMPVEIIFASFGYQTGGAAIDMALFVSLAISFMVAIISTTAASISLEGRNVWIIKSLPVAPGVIYSAKSAVDLTIKLPCLLISSVILTISLKTGVVEFLLYFIIPTLYSLYSSQIGLMIDLRKPNYTWTNEAQVVKQGLSVILTMVAGMAAVAAPIAALATFASGHAVPVLAAVCVLIPGITAAVHLKLRKMRI